MPPLGIFSVQTHGSALSNIWFGYFVQPKPKLFRKSVTLVAKGLMFDNYFQHQIIRTLCCILIFIAACFVLHILSHIYKAQHYTNSCLLVICSSKNEDTHGRLSSFQWSFDSSNIKRLIMCSLEHMHFVIEHMKNLICTYIRTLLLFACLLLSRSGTMTCTVDWNRGMQVTEHCHSTICVLMQQNLMY